MKKLRTYQKHAVKAVLSALDSGERPILVAPTGSGKTVMGARIVRERKGPVLWVVHRRELMRQALQHLESEGCEAGLLTERSRVVVASPLAAATVRGAVFRTIVIDECHRALASSYTQLLAKHPNAAVVGLTATPWRLDRKAMRGVFSRLVVAADFPELIAGKYLVAPVCFGVPEDKAKSLLEGISSSENDYSVTQLSRSLIRPKVLGDVVSEHKRFGGDKKTLVFAVSSVHADKLAKRFRKAGRTAEVLRHDMPTADRDEVLRRFRDGDLQIIVNVDILSEGFDMAAVQCVSLVRPTKSLTRYLQYVGRALRPYGEEPPVVIDHVGNIWRHGLPEIHREWTLDQRPIRRRAVDAHAAVWRCDDCGMLIPLSTSRCPGCNFDGSRSLLREDRSVRLERLSKPWPPCVVCGKPCKHDDSALAARPHCSRKCREADPEKPYKKVRLRGTCAYCGKEATFKKSATAKKFCSTECYHASRRIPSTNKCLFCGKDGISARKTYCGRECLKADFRARGAALPSRQPHPCEFCGNMTRGDERERGLSSRYCSRKCAIAARKASGAQR